MLDYWNTTAAHGKALKHFNSRKLVFTMSYQDFWFVSLCFGVTASRRFEEQSSSSGL
jgi:hypothetical protein